MKFQKKPEMIEAIQWDGTKECEERIQQMAGPGVHADWRKATGYVPIIVPTRSGQVVHGAIGGWVVKDQLGILDYKTHEHMIVGYAPIEDTIAGPACGTSLNIPDDSFSQEGGK